MQDEQLTQSPNSQESSFLQSNFYLKLKRNRALVLFLTPNFFLLAFCFSLFMGEYFSTAESLAISSIILGILNFAYVISWTDVIDSEERRSNSDDSIGGDQ